MKKTIMFLGMLSLGLAQAQQNDPYEGKVGVNTETPSATLNVKSKTGTTASTKNFELQNATNKKLVTVLDDGKVGIGTETPVDKLHIYGGKVAVTGGDGRYTSLLGDIQLQFNRDSDAYISNIAPKGRLHFLTGGGTEKGLKMTIFENGNVGIGTGNIGSRLSVKGSSNYGVIRVLSASPTTESTIGYGIADAPSEKTWMTGVNPKLGKGFNISLGGTMRMYITENGNVGIGTILSPDDNIENKLYIKATADPLKLEGLQAATGTNTQNLVVENGVVKVGSAVSDANVKLGTGTSKPCNSANAGTINYEEITREGKKTGVFGFCMKRNDNEYVWAYMVGGTNPFGTSADGANFADGIKD